MIDPRPSWMDEEYTCARCGETYLKGRSNETADKEHEEVFGCPRDEDSVLICDDCWKMLMEPPSGHA